MSRPLAILITVFLLIVAAVSAVRHFKEAPPVVVSPAAPAPSVNAAPVAKLPAERVRHIFRDPRAAIAIPAEGDVEPACRTLWDEMRATVLEQALAYPPHEHALPVASGCTKFPAELSKFHAKFLEDCGDFLTKPKSIPQAAWMAKAPQCQLALFQYRANVTDWLTRNTPLKDISDTKVLLDKLMARLADNPAAAAEVAERLLQLEPGMYPAAKAAMMSRFMDAQSTAQGKPDDPKWTKSNLAQEVASKIDPSDQAQQTELKLMTTMRQYGDPARLREQGSEMAKAFPNLPTGPYYAAWGEYLAGNKKGAMEWLEEAKRRAPTDQRVNETLGKVVKGETDAFQARLSFSQDPSQY